MRNKQDEPGSITDQASKRSAMSDEFANLRGETDRQFETWFRTLNQSSVFANNPSIVVNEASDYIPANPRAIEFAGTLSVDGYIRGFIYSPSGKLIITEAGEIEGDIAVSEAIINGQVRGDISAPHSVVLGSKARVTGNIETRALSIQPGAGFEGQCAFPAVKLDHNDIQQSDSQKARAANAIK